MPYDYIFSSRNQIPKCLSLTSKTEEIEVLRPVILLSLPCHEAAHVLKSLPITQEFTLNL